MKREEKLKKIIQDQFEDNQAEFARAISRSPAQVNQWLNGYRKIGDAVALHIEKSLGLPIGWMDTNNSSINFKYNDDIVKLKFDHVIMIRPFNLKILDKEGNQMDVSDFEQLSEDVPIPYSFIHENNIKEEDLQALKINTKNMEPVVHHGSVIAIDFSKKHYEEGRVLIIQRSSKLIMRRIKLDKDGVTWMYTSDNTFDASATEMYAKPDDIVMGRVVLKLSNDGL